MTTKPTQDDEQSKLIEGMTVHELSDLIKEMEEKFDIPPVSVGVAAPRQEPTFSVVLTAAGDNKVQVMKVVRAITGLGLKEAKNLVYSTPTLIKSGVTAREADYIVKIIKGLAGGVATKHQDSLGVHQISLPHEISIKENMAAQIRESFLDLVTANSLGLDTANIPLTRVLPVNVYLGDGAHHAAVLDALRSLLGTFELEILDADDPIFSSYFQRLWAKTFSKETTDELKRKLEKIEKALEAQQIDKPKSEVELNQANAAATFLNAIGNDSKSAMAQIGNLLIFSLVDEKEDKHVRVITLTTDQVEMLQQNQELLFQPEVLLKQLSTVRRLTGTK